MKVTKIVREFVEEEVNKKYPIPKLDKAAGQLDKDIDSIRERIKREAGEFIFKKMKEAGLQIDNRVASIKIDAWRGLDENGDTCYNYIINNLREANRKLCDETKTKRETAMRNILVSLELGGTKKELMEMLANLPD